MNVDYLWRPSSEAVESANSTRFARAHGIDSYDALVKRSISDPEWFWDAIVEHLGVHFETPYARTLDVSRGSPWARWFIGGELNLSWNCVDRHVGNDNDAIRWEGEDGATRSLSFSQLRDQVAGAAGGLRELGVGPGDRVGLMVPLVPEAVIAFYAIVRLGGIVVPMFSGFAAPAIAARLRDSGAAVMITARRALRRGQEVALAATVAEALRDATAVRTVVVLETDSRRGALHEGRSLQPETPGCRWISWADMPPAEADAVALPSEHPLMIGYTSGTTGSPKGAVHVHGGFLVKTAQEVHFQADLKPGDALCWLSDMGWIMAPWAIVGTHANGGTLVIYDGAPDVPDAERLWTLAERHAITFLGLSPTLVRGLRAQGSKLTGRYDLGRLRLFGSAGEPWNEEPYRWLFDEIGKRKRPIINLSGGTEVGSSFLSADISIPLRACSLGRPALGMAMAVYGPDGLPAPPGTVGELVCAKPWPSMTRGIWGDPERYLATYWTRWPSVWVHGDWASVDEDGSWFLHGRSDDTLNVAGKRVGAAEYESALADHPAVLEACVVGVPHPVKGETACCFVVLQAGKQVSDELRGELRHSIEVRMGKAFRAEEMWFVSALPRTRSGKIVRRAVRALLIDESPGDLSTLEDVGALDEIRRVAQGRRAAAANAGALA